LAAAIEQTCGNFSCEGVDVLESSLMLEMIPDPEQNPLLPPRD